MQFHFGSNPKTHKIATPIAANIPRRTMPTFFKVNADGCFPGEEFLFFMICTIWFE